MNNMKAIYTIIIVIFSLSAVKAQELLTVERAIEIALENNYDIQLANKDVEVAENNKSIYNSGYLPTVTASAGGSYSDGDSDSEFQDGTVNSVDGYISRSYNASVGLNYTLFDGFNRKNAFEKLKETYNLTELQARQVIENEFIKLHAAYYEVARLSENLANQKETLDISKQRLTRAKYNFEYGQNTKLDVLNAEVDVNNDSIAFLDISRQLSNTKRDLNIIVGRNVNTQYEVNTNVDFQLDLNIDDLLKQAKQNNSTLLQSQKNIEISKYDVKINQSGWLPKVNLNSSYTWNKTNNDAINQFSTVGSTQTGINAGLNLSWDIFDGGQTKTRTQNAKITVETQEIRKVQLEEQLNRDLYNAWETYQNTLFTYEVQEQNVTTNRNNFERTNERYKLGQVTSIDFRQAQNNLLNAELNLSQAKYDAKNAELQLLQLAGLLVN